MEAVVGFTMVVWSRALLAPVLRTLLRPQAGDADGGAAGAAAILGDGGDLGKKKEKLTSEAHKKVYKIT
jgi:hypothetical protein